LRRTGFNRRQDIVSGEGHKKIRDRNGFLAIIIRLSI
jgi:hypothetical protein